MLLFPVLSSEKDQSYEKQVNAKVHRLLLPYLIPGLFHFFTPMDIIQYHNTVFMQNR